MPMVYRAKPYTFGAMNTLALHGPKIGSPPQCYEIKHKGMSEEGTQTIGGLCFPDLESERRAACWPGTGGRKRFPTLGDTLAFHDGIRGVSLLPTPFWAMRWVKPTSRAKGAKDCLGPYRGGKHSLYPSRREVTSSKGIGGHWWRHPSTSPKSVSGTSSTVAENPAANFTL